MSDFVAVDSGAVGDSGRSDRWIKRFEVHPFDCETRIQITVQRTEFVETRK